MIYFTKVTKIYYEKEEERKFENGEFRSLDQKISDSKDYRDYQF